MARQTGRDERFDTGGRAFGWLGIACAVGLAVLWLTRLDNPLPAPVLSGAVLGGLVCWAAIIRPAVWVAGDDLVLRNVLQSVRIPLAAIDEHRLGPFLAVRAGGRRYVGAGIGRRSRRTPRPSRAARATGAWGGVQPAPRISAADVVETRLATAIRDARASGSAAGDRSVVRRPDWLVIALLATAVLTVILTVVL